ncbi:hypothetical protein MYX84_01500 [Acidobacteria bacterium AH-259-O06]|nr:hypothetical protein [Acidobacteria bacterium AH-259-O06]
MKLTADALEPVSVKAAFRNLRDRLDAFEVAFRRGPVDARQVMDIWEKTLELRGECEQFHQFLLNYWAIVNGILWAHHPEEYREKIYPRIQQGNFLESALIGVADLTSQKRQPKAMLDVAEEIFLSQNNEPLSISDLIAEMKGKGVRFKAKDPVKSLAQTMRNSGRFETVRRGIYRLK